MLKGSPASIDLVRRMLLSTPAVKEATLHGSASFKLHGRLLACPALHKSAEANSLVVSIDKAERAALIAREPASYIRDHYAGHDVVLLRLAKISHKSLRALLEAAVRFVNAKSANKRPRAAPTLARKKTAVGGARRRAAKSIT